MEIKNKSYGTQYHKSSSICNWKRRGLIHQDFDSLYEEYINCTQCQHCKKKFTSTRDRCVDHDHQTGMFRKILCNKCNSRDSYIKYPNGFDKNKWHRTYRQNKNEINKCGCGGKYKNDHKQTHYKTFKHMDWYMNSVD